MCFSATASFIASGSLAVIGTATVKKVDKKREIPLALAPFLFAIQQFVEGLIWLSFGKERLLGFLAVIYNLFAYLFWPVAAPIAVYLVEPVKYRKKIMVALMALGIFVSLFNLYLGIQNPVQLSIAGNNIQHIYQGGFPGIIIVLYVLALGLPLILSSFRMLNILGVAAFVSAFIANELYEQAFASTWCFFAAILSTLIYIHFRSIRKGQKT